MFKLKGGATIFLQDQSGIEFLSSLTGQAFEDGCPFRKDQIPDIVFREERATHFTEDMEIAPLVPALGYLGIDTYAFASAFGAAKGRIGFLHTGKREQFLTDSTHIGIDVLREFLFLHLS